MPNVSPDYGMLCVGAAEWSAFAPHVRGHVERIADDLRDYCSADDIARAVASDRMMLWVMSGGTAIDCVVLSELAEYPRRRALRLLGISAEDPSRWAPMLPLIEHVARAFFDCDLIQATNFRDHEPFLVTIGWTQRELMSERRI